LTEGSLRFPRKAVNADPEANAGPVPTGEKNGPIKRTTRRGATAHFMLSNIRCEGLPGVIGSRFIKFVFPKLMRPDLLQIPRFDCYDLKLD